MAVSALAAKVLQSQDEALKARLQQGDLQVFEQVYALYGPSVFRYAFYLTGDRDEAADIKQETFLRAYRSVGGFRADSSLQTWLLKICLNLCRDRLRRREHRDRVQQDLSRNLSLNSTERGDPQSALERAQTVETILRALDGLPPAQREVIILHEIEGLDCREMSRILGCTSATVRMRLFRARHALKTRVLALMEDREKR